MIIEPCCCHRQLPPLCKENLHRLTAFHTNGDVTVEKVFAATAYLVGTSRMTLITPRLDSNLTQYLSHCFTRGWITELNVLTAPIDGQNTLKSPSLGEGRGRLVVDKRITESSAMFILEGEDHRLCITGYLPPSSPADTDNIYRMVTHTLLYTTTDNSLIWDEVTKIPCSPFRLHK